MTNVLLRHNQITPSKLLTNLFYFTLEINVLGSDGEKYKLSGTFDRLKTYFFNKKLETIEILRVLDHFFSEILKNLTTGFPYTSDVSVAQKLHVNFKRVVLGGYWVDSDSLEVL